MWQPVFFFFSCLSIVSATLSIYLYLFDTTNAQLLAGQGHQTIKLGRIESAGSKVLTLQDAQAKSMERINSTLNALQKSSEYRNKYPLGYCVFYADGRNEIMRVGQTGEVNIFWDRTRVRLTSQLVSLQTAYSGRRSGAFFQDARYANTFARRKSDPVLIATIFNSTDLVFEIVEDQGTGVVCVFGVRGSSHADDDEMVIFRM